MKKIYHDENSERYHLTFGTSRTTITVDSILAEMMAFKLGFEPLTTEAHSALRAWIQRQIDAHGIGRKGSGKSQWVRRILIKEISNKKIRDRWEDWYFSLD